MEDGGQEGQWFEKPWKNARAMGRWTITRSCYAPSTSCSDKNIKCKAILSQVYNSMSWKWSTLKCLKKDKMEDEVAKAIKTQTNMHTLGVWLETIGHMVGTWWEHQKTKKNLKSLLPLPCSPKEKKNNGWVHLVSNKFGYVHSFEPLDCIALFFKSYHKSILSLGPSLSLEA